MEQRSDVKQISQAHLSNMTGAPRDANIPNQSPFDDADCGKAANRVTPTAS
jgi:hypothetical protein